MQNLHLVTSGEQEVNPKSATNKRKLRKKSEIEPAMKMIQDTPPVYMTTKIQRKDTTVSPPQQSSEPAASCTSPMQILQQARVEAHKPKIIRGQLSTSKVLRL